VRYLLFHKPYGVLSQFTDRQCETLAPSADRLTLKAFIDLPNVYPVGRLDRDSEGLLFLTDDGKLASQLIHPRYGHPRTYWAQVEGVPTAEMLDALRQGVTIGSFRTRSAIVREIAPPKFPPRSKPIRERRHIPTRWLELTLSEGRNRQVRRMTAAVGLPTLRLVRVKLGMLSLDELLPGEWRELTQEEVDRLRQSVGQFGSIKNSSF
jgi:23S rRNA pseudouridine2457 synthase